MKSIGKAKDLFSNATCRCDAFIHNAGEGPGWVIFCKHLNRSATQSEIEKYNTDN